MNPASDTLKGKVAIVTGAGRGIGRAIARRLGAAGATVVLAARNADQLDDSRRLIERDGGRAVAISTDVSNLDAVAAMVAETVERFGHLDILINNAGVAPVASIEEMEPAMFETILSGNVRSVYACCRAAWPHLKAAGGGVIVNISSMAALDPFPGLSAYGGAKAFVNTYTRALAAEGQEAGIRVYAVAPGAVETEMLRGGFPDFPAEKTLSPDEVAAAVEMLIGPAARPMNGQTFVVKKD